MWWCLFAPETCELDLYLRAIIDGPGTWTLPPVGLKPCQGGRATPATSTGTAGANCAPRSLPKRTAAGCAVSSSTLTSGIRIRGRPPSTRSSRSVEVARRMTETTAGWPICAATNAAATAAPASDLSSSPTAACDNGEKPQVKEPGGGIPDRAMSRRLHSTSALHTEAKCPRSG